MHGANGDNDNISQGLMLFKSDVTEQLASQNQPRLLSLINFSLKMR